MRNFQLIHAGLDVAPILAELDAAPELWDADTDRTERAGSPHADSSDIWLRWFPPNFAGDRRGILTRLASASSGRRGTPSRIAA